MTCCETRLRISRAHGRVISDVALVYFATQCCHQGSRPKVSLAGVKDWKVLKTTQSGYEGFKHDKYTLLPDTKERMVATSITSTWK